MLPEEDQVLVEQQEKIATLSSAFTIAAKSIRQAWNDYLNSDKNYVGIGYSTDQPRRNKIFVAYLYIMSQVYNIHHILIILLLLSLE